MNINFRRFIYILSILIIIFYFNFFPYQSVRSEEFIKTTIYVDISGEGNYSSIQSAIDEAEPGDTIFVKNGVYYENIVIDKSIILIGENNTNTIIDGRSAGNVIKLNSNNIIIQNFTIQNSGIYFPNCGVNITSKYNNIINNIIKNNLYGIILYGSLNNTIINNIIKENKNCGIYISNSSFNNILNNRIIDHDFNGIGIYDKSNNNSIIKNNLLNNGYCGVNIKISYMNEIMMNNISNNYIGIKNPSSTNIIADNYIFNNNVDIEKESESPSFKLGLFILSISFILYFIIKKKEKLN